MSVDLVEFFHKVVDGKVTADQASCLVLPELPKDSPRLLSVEAVNTFAAGISPDTLRLVAMTFLLKSKEAIVFDLNVAKRLLQGQTAYYLQVPRIATLAERIAPNIKRLSEHDDVVPLTITRNEIKAIVSLFSTGRSGATPHSLKRAKMALDLGIELYKAIPRPTTGPRDSGQRQYGGRQVRDCGRRPGKRLSE